MTTKFDVPEFQVGDTVFGVDHIVATAYMACALCDGQGKAIRQHANGDTDKVDCPECSGVGQVSDPDGERVTRFHVLGPMEVWRMSTLHTVAKPRGVTIYQVAGTMRDWPQLFESSDAANTWALAQGFVIYPDEN